MVKVKSIILCAGFATRLYPLTLNQPKPLLIIAGEPIISHIMAKIKAIKEIDEVFVVTNQKFFDNFIHWREKYIGEKPIRIINDGTLSNEDKLGALGDIDFVVNKEKLYNEEIMVIAGDNLFDFDLRMLVDSFNEKKASVIALYDVKEKSLIKGKYGAVILGKDGKVVGIEEKPSKPKTTLVSTACYIFSKNDIKGLGGYLRNKEESKKFDNLGNFIKFLAEKGSLYGLTFTGRWFDIGDKVQLMKAARVWKPFSST